MAEFTALFPFCGLGAGARGFLDAEITFLGEQTTFRSLGGIDVDAEACRDFERLTGSPALHADVATLKPDELRAFAGPEVPDVVFSSPPCKGFSGLLSKKAARKEKYQALNRLVMQWLELVMATWTERPRLVLLENVPRITTRGKGLLTRIKRLLRKEGYVFDERTHDCGEVGGLAQHRVRYLLVARLPRRCPPLLYQPPAKRVRGCGELLGKLPLPEDPAAGVMHQLPKISWLNWVRLALIPAGGDWRDLPGVVAEGQERRAVYKRHELAKWDEPTGVIAGVGSNGVGAVADPRPAGLDEKTSFRNTYRVLRWGDPTSTIIGATRPGSGSLSICDPRPAIAWHNDSLGVRDWEEPSGTVTGRAHPSTGRFSVADPRPNNPMYDHAYRVLRWGEPSFTVAGKTSPGCGAYSVADERVRGRPEKLTFEDLIGAWDGNPKRPPPFVPVIIADDGCWHRPMTTLELAMLQGLPVELDGAPLKLEGPASSRWRERIGNAVPVQTATAIATQMLVALSEAAAGTFSFGSTPVWVEPERSEMRA